jgi:hypothetical protein
MKNKFLWEIINFLVRVRFYIIYKFFKDPDFNNTILENWVITKYDDMSNPNNWIATQVGNWGSARPDNIVVLTENNVSFSDSGLAVISKKEDPPITGKGWYGEDVIRNYSSGSINSVDLKSPFGRFSAECEVNLRGDGSWPAFWFFTENVIGEENLPFDDKTYFEIDGFEHFGNLKNKQKISFTVHSGTSGERHPFNCSVYFPDKELIKFRCCIIVENGYIKIMIDNILAYITNFGYPTDKYQMRIIMGDSLSTFQDTISLDIIDQTLPHNFKVTSYTEYSRK